MIQKPTIPDNFSHSATILPVSIMDKSLLFYIEKLGFKQSFKWGEPITYAVLKNGGVSIHLVAKKDNYLPSKEHCAIYIFVNNVIEAYKTCIDHDVPILRPLEKRDYQMQDFDILDPDGYILTFGRGE